MTLKRIVDLPIGQTPNGSEVFEAVQNGISVQLSLNQVITFNAINLRQFKAALVTEGEFYQVNNAIPADPGNLTNIQWTNGDSVSVNDALYTLVMTTLSYTGTQMAALLALAATLPR